MAFDTHWQESIYAIGKALNRYPYGELVSQFFYARSLIKDIHMPHVLELGCGGGNNLWFMAELGCEVHGVDGSIAACQKAKELCKSRGAEVSVSHATFDALPFEDASFDIIIDREATYCGTFESMKLWWREASRVLKPGGVVIAFLFSDDHPQLQALQEGECSATKIEERTYTNFSGGAFEGTGIAHFSSHEEILELFGFCDIVRLSKNSNIPIHTKTPYVGFAEWMVVGVKR